jgi:sulfur-oxidizing protein SoxX|nr:sulfur oxidation c-type cytochrome SoxX [Panacagrimonas sp.]
MSRRSMFRRWTCVMAATLGVAFVVPLQAEGVADSFRAKGQAKLDRLDQTDMQRICSGPVGMTVPDDVRARLQKTATDSVKFPAADRFLGKWEAGQKIAQTGTGMQSSDDPAVPSGGNCYACHQMAPTEMSYGTLGPSLAGYGKQRGQSEAMLKYTWTRIWNPQAHMPCSHMPRFGDAGILTEEQIRDVMAFLFDPASPVNK